MWDKLRNTLGRVTHYPVPCAPNDGTLRDQLEEFYVRDEPRFKKLFLNEKPLAVKPGEQTPFDEYERAGLIRAKTDGLYLPCVRVSRSTAR